MYRCLYTGSMIRQLSQRKLVAEVVVSFLDKFAINNCSFTFSSNLAFFNPPSCPFYQYPEGVLSPYGAESLPLLHSLAEAGKLDTESVAAKAYAAFKVYPDEAVTGYVGRLNHIGKEFVAQRDQGKEWKDCNVDDSQANGIAKVPALVARYGGTPELQPRIAEMVSVFQRSTLSIECSVLFGTILERILFKHEAPGAALLSVFADADELSLTTLQRNMLSFITSNDKLAEYSRFATALATISADENDQRRNARVSGATLNSVLGAGSFTAGIERVNLEAKDKAIIEQAVNGMAAVSDSAVDLSDLKALAKTIGLSCALPGAALVVMLVMLRANSLEEAIELNLAIRGDNCSRACVLGGAFGAASAPPALWVQKVQSQKWWTFVASASRKVSISSSKLSSIVEFLILS